MTHYRLAKKADAPQLASLRWALRTEDCLQPDPSSKHHFIKNFVVWMEATSDREVVHWVADKDQELIGVMSVRIIPMMPSPEAFQDYFGYLTNSYVLPAHRNNGVGSALLAEVKKWALCESLELLVVWPSERAYHFYERSGYLRLPDPVVLKLRT